MQKAKDFYSPLSGLSCKSKTISQVHGLLSSCDWSLSAGLGAAKSSGTLAGEKANITPWSPCLVLPQHPTVWSNPLVSTFSTSPQLNSTQLNSTQLNSPRSHGGSSLLHNNFSIGSWFDDSPLRRTNLTPAAAGEVYRSSSDQVSTFYMLGEVRAHPRHCGDVPDIETKCQVLTFAAHISWGCLMRSILHN